MKKSFWWFLLAIIPLAAILATEVYNCHWSFGEYTCDLISEEPKTLVDDVEVIDADQEDSLVTLKIGNWNDL